MKDKIAVINVETHFIEWQGKVYAESLMDSLFWQKYLNVFNDLYVLVRMKEYDGEDLSRWILSSCEHVHFLKLPDYRGPKGYVKEFFKIQKLMQTYIKDYPEISCAIIRSPSPLGYQFLKYWRRTKKPFGMEIVANYSDDYYYSIDFINSLLYKRLHLMTKKYAWNANGVAYVTKEVLQKVYPTRGIQLGCSDIALSKEHCYARLPIEKKLDEYILLHVSTLQLDAKGHEEFFQVQRNLLEDGYPVRSVVVGGGRYLEHYRKRAKELGLEDKVRFTGHISNKTDLMKEYRTADMLLFPTLTEGLPRIVIEAMASSLPCVSSDIPSIRELLDAEWLCDPKDVSGFTRKMKMLMDNAELYNHVAKRNYTVSLEYEYGALNRRACEFYRRICE